MPKVEPVVQLGPAHKNGEAVTMLIGEAKPAIVAWLAATRELSELEEHLTAEAATDAALRYASARTIMLLSGVAAVLIGVGMAFWLTRSITVPIGQALNIAQTVAQGDLSQRAEEQASAARRWSTRPAARWTTWSARSGA